MFKEKELKVASMKLRGLSNRQIAEKLEVSEPDVSQTLGRIRGKITGVKDSVSLLTQIGVIHEGPMLALTEKGRELTDIGKMSSSRYRLIQSKTSVNAKLVPNKLIFPTTIDIPQIYGSSVIQRTMHQGFIERKSYKEMEIKRISD